MRDLGDEQRLGISQDSKPVRKFLTKDSRELIFVDRMATFIPDKMSSVFFRQEEYIVLDSSYEEKNLIVIVERKSIDLTHTP